MVQYAYGFDQPGSFTRRDAGRGTSECRGGALSNLDENRGAAFDGDQIDFAESAAIIARDDFEPVLLQERRGEFFGGNPQPVHELLSTL